jgi:hypothetical protein
MGNKNETAMISTDRRTGQREIYRQAIYLVDKETNKKHSRKMSWYRPQGLGFTEATTLWSGHIYKNGNHLDSHT